MRKLSFDKNIDFIGFAITPLHIKNIIAFAEDFNVSGVVIVAPHINTGYPKNINELEKHGIKIVKIDEPYEEFENKGQRFLVDDKGKELLFFTAFFKDDWAKIICENLPDRNIKYIIIDSGIGSYHPDIGKEIRSRISDNVIDARKYIKKSDNTFCLNEKYADVYISALKEAKIENKKFIDETIEGSVLICTQPLIEDGIINDDRDVLLYKEIMNYPPPNQRFGGGILAFHNKET